MPWTLVLGNNRIVNCDAVLVVEDEEVFRLRERDKDGNLVVDFDLRALDGTRIAKVAKNYVAYAAPGYAVRNRTGVAEVINETTGEVVARIEAQGPDTVTVVGTFHVKGHTVKITPTYLDTGGVTMSGNEIHGSGKAIALKRGSTGIGAA